LVDCQSEADRMSTFVFRMQMPSQSSHELPVV
jgi:hypothetical protein